MDIAPFAIEAYFARHEFTAPFILCASDCETLTVGELLALAGPDGAFASRLHGLRLGYTESQGAPALREAIAETYEDVAPDEVLFLAAPEEGIFVLMHALLEPGDEAVVLMPAYNSLRYLADHICGPGRVKSWWLTPTEGGWELDLAQLASLITPRTRLLVVNFPHNPTGYLPDKETFAGLLELAGRHDLWLFCDEMYRGLELEPAGRLPSAIDRAERVLVLGGLSKAYGLPGLRAGWLVSRDEAVRERLLNWKFYTTICSPGPTELLSLAALQAGEALLERCRAIVVENVATSSAFFARWPELFNWRPPQAGSIALVECRGFSAASHCARAVEEAGVLLLPGDYFDIGDQFMRWGLGRANFAACLAPYERFLQRMTIEGAGVI